MCASSFKERFARLGRVRTIDRETSYSPAVLVLRRARTKVDTIDATVALTKRGMTMLRAKRAVERVVERGRALVHVPNVGSVNTLARELVAAGIKVSRLRRPDEGADVARMLKATRESLELSQEEFALQYQLDKDALENWEQGRRNPDAAAAAYLKLIARDPEGIARALEEELS